MMRTFRAVLAVTLLATACTAPAPDGPQGLVVDVLVRHTPPPRQAAAGAEWVYALISLVESDRMAMADSVHLSTQSLVRAACLDAWLRGNGHPSPLPPRGNAAAALRLMRQYGVFTYDAYPDTLPPHLPALLRALERADSRAEADSLLNAAFGYLPPRVYLYGAVYTPQELAASVLEPDTYEAFMSDTRHTFFAPIPNSGDMAESRIVTHNLPLRALVDTAVATLRRGSSLIWEGDMSEPGCRHAANGRALWPVTQRAVTAAERQHDLQKGLTTPDATMHLVGLAHDAHGQPYFILKTGGAAQAPAWGYLLMNANYLRMKTLRLIRRLPHSQPRAGQR